MNEEIKKEDMTPICNCNGGKGTIYVSKAVPIIDTIEMINIIIPPGASYVRDKDDKRQETLYVQNNASAIFNGCTFSKYSCLESEPCECMNNSQEDIIVVSCKE